MDPIFLIHNAARHYCIEGIAKWSKQHEELCAARGDQVIRCDGSWKYTKDAYRVFPRYQVLMAILSEVERFIPADFKTESDARALLSTAAGTAESVFTKSDNEIAIDAMDEERAQFRKFIGSIELDACAALSPLPFRRVLAKEEHDALHSAFRAKWGNWYGGCAESDPSDCVTLHVAAMDDPDSYSKLRKALIDRGITRVFELRESGNGYELDVEAAGFLYTGDEGFWTSGDLSWMVYASHESSITFGATWLVNQMRSALPGFERYIYKGWDLAAYRQ